MAVGHDHSGTPGVNLSAGVTRVFIVDLESGDVSRLPGVEPRGLDQVRLYPAIEGGLLVITTADPGSPAVVVQRFDSSNVLINEIRLANASLRLRPSPDGRWQAWRASRDDAIAEISLARSESGEVVLRALQVLLPHAPPGQPRPGWLSDSSGLVVETASGFAVLRPDGALEELPFGPADWPERGWPQVPVPAPHDARLFVYRGRVVDVTGQSVGADIAAAEWVGRDPWNLYGLDSEGRELHLVRSTVPQTDLPGTIGAFPSGPRLLSTLGLPARIELPPFAGEVRLAINTGGDGLNVRPSPGVSAGRAVCYNGGTCEAGLPAGEQILGAFSDATIVTVTKELVEEWQVSAAWVTEPAGTEGTWWLHVQREDGLEGWVRSDFLAWAE
jgi:hypothetical protein